MKQLRALAVVIPLFALGDATLDEGVAEASTSYAGYLRCEDIKVKDLLPLRSGGASVTLKANTTLGTTTVQGRAAITAEETGKTPTVAFGVPATKTHAVRIMGPTTSGFEVAIERESKDSAVLDVAICVGHTRLSPDGDDQKSETVGKGSLQAGDTKQVLWQKKGAMSDKQLYFVLVQPYSVATSTQYKISVQRRSDWK